MTVLTGLTAAVLAAAALAATPVTAAPTAAATTAHELTVTAAPRWGPSRPGAWTTYAVTAANPGRRSFEGHVALVPEPAPASAPEPSPPGGPEPAADPIVIALGTTELTEPARAGPARRVADHPTYRSPVVLAAGGSPKRLNVPVVEAPYGYRAELRDRAGNLHAASDPEPRAHGDRPVPTVAVLSQDPAAPASLAGLDDVVGPEGAGLSVISSARDFPTSALLLAGLDCMVLVRFDLGALSAAQRQAVVDFVAFGGSLVLAGGADGRRSLASVPDALVPLPPTGTASAALAPLADLVARTSDARAPIITGELRRGRALLAAPGGPPLLVQAGYGAGQVVQVAYDPLAAPVADDSFLRDLSWRHALLAALDRFEPGQGVSGRAPPEQLWSPALATPGWPQWPAPASWLLVAYALVGPPLAYALLRRRRRPELMWAAAVPALAVALAVAALWWVQPHPAPAAVQVRTLGPGGEVLVNSYLGSSTGGGRRPGQQAAGALTTTFVAPALLGRPGPVASAPPGGGGSVIDLDGTGLAGATAGPATSSAVQRVTIGHEGALESRLTLTGSGPPELGSLRVTGTIRNRRATAVRLLRAQLPEGAVARLAEVIAPGQALEIDAPFVWPRRVPAGSGLPAAAEEKLMFAAASETFSRSGQAVVVGLDTQAGGATTVVVAPVVLAGAETLVAQSTDARLVASFLEPAGSTVAVHDLGGLAGAYPRQLEYGPFSPAVEVYHWTTGAWRPAGAGGGGRTPGLTPVEPDEVGDGTVRIRTRGDPRFVAYKLAQPRE